MTAHATIEERQRCLAAGMNDHISKPIDPDNLFATVGRFCPPAERGAPENRSPDLSPPQPRKEQSEEKPPTPSRLDELTRPEGRTPVPDGIPSIAGLDAQDGLARVRQNQKLYRRLLRQFSEQQGPVISQVTDALSRGDVALAERLAHTLKGLAGNLGAKPVQSAAAVLEKAIRSQAPMAEVEVAMRQVAAVLDPLIAGLSTALNPTLPEISTPVSTSTPGDPAQSRAAAAQLDQLLSEFDPVAADFIETHQAALRPLFNEGTWAEFEKLVQGYSFAEARTQLEPVIKSLPPA